MHFLRILFSLTLSLSHYFPFVGSVVFLPSWLFSCIYANCSWLFCHSMSYFLFSCGSDRERGFSRGSPSTRCPALRGQRAKRAPPQPRERRQPRVAAGPAQQGRIIHGAEARVSAQNAKKKKKKSKKKKNANHSHVTMVTVCSVVCSCVNAHVVWCLPLVKPELKVKVKENRSIDQI